MNGKKYQNKKNLIGIILISILSVILISMAIGFVNELIQLKEPKITKKSTSQPKSEVPYQVESQVSYLEKKLAKEEVKNTKLRSELTLLKSKVVSLTKFFSNEIVEKTRQVGLEARKSVLWGTAWVIAPGLIVTNGHNVVGVGIKGMVKLETIDGETFEAEVLGYELEPLDVAILGTNYTKLTPLRIGSSKNLKVGDPLIQIGHPSAIGRWVISLGPVTHNSGEGWILSKVPILGGNSGSPVLTLDGKVVGMTSGFTSGGVDPDKPITDAVYLKFEIEELTTSDRIEDILTRVEKWASVKLEAFDDS